MSKTAQEIVDELNGAELKEVFHLAGKRLGHHNGGVHTLDDDGNGDALPPESGGNGPPPKKP